MSCCGPLRPRAHLAQSNSLVIGQLPTRCAHVLLDMIGRVRTHDHRRDLGMGEQPRDRDLYRRLATCVTDAPELRAAAEQFADYVRGETLATELDFEPIAGAEPIELAPAGAAITLYVKVDKAASPRKATR